jgi:GAF domain-containing protein
MEELNVSGNTKEEKYKELFPQIRALVEDEPDFVANMANFCAALKHGMNFYWVGFYLVQQNELVLGPFQGPIACTRIPKGKGVCGTSWLKNETIIVEDVDQFPGHIACSSASRSEIVLPLYFHSGEFAGVLDVDSDHLATFDSTDQDWLEKLLQLLTPVNKPV